VQVNQPADDYFALLSLDLDCDDPALIRAAVARKRTQCAQGAMVGADKAACAQLLARLPEIERALLDPAARKQARESARRLRSSARTERLEAFHEDLAMVLAGGRESITAPERDHLVKEHSNAEGPTAAELSALITVPVVAEAPRAAAAVAALPPYEARDIQKNLAVLGKADLYDFLGLPPAAAAAKIKARREELSGIWNRKARATPEKSAAQALLGKVATLLLDPAKRASYAATLRAARFAPLQQSLKLALLDGHLSASEHANLLARARRLGLSTEDAENAILAAAAAAGARVEATPAAAKPKPAAAKPKPAATRPTPAPVGSGKLIATFKPSCGLAGKTITWKDHRLILDSRSPVSAALVLNYDRQGHLAWAYAGLREWVQELAGLSDAAVHGATNVWVVGVCTIVGTRDSGVTWREYGLDMSEGLFAVAFPDATHGWAVGMQGAILATDNGGATWRKQSTGCNDWFSGVAFSDVAHGWVVGSPAGADDLPTDGNTILATADGGVTWSRQRSGTNAQLEAVSFVDRTHGWAVGDDGVVLATADGGSTWRTQRSPQSGQFGLNGVTFIDIAHGWAVGFATVLATTDGGATWRKQNTRENGFWRDVTFHDASHGWVVGWEGIILATTNGGTTWSRQDSGTAENLNAIAFRDASHGWAVGEKGIILATTNGGQTWSKRGSDTSFGLCGVAFGRAPW